MRKPIAYMAGPLGFSEVGRLFHNSVLIPLLRESGYAVRDPWILTPQEIIDNALKLPYGQEKKKRLQAINSLIGQNNAHAIEESDIIVAVLDGIDVDSGTASEIGYGAALGKPILGYRGDFRLSSDNEGGIINLQVEFFIRRNGGDIVTDTKSLQEALMRFRQKFQ